MTFAELVDRVASNGPFQLLHTVLLGLPILGMANHNLLQIFTAATPTHHCRPPPNASMEPWVLPMGWNGKPEPCLRFAYPSNASLPNDTQGATEPCLDGWTYDVSSRDSIVAEWDLVCNSSKLKELAQSIFMAGILIGGLMLGALSDRFGRKPILTCSYLLLAASGSGAAFSPTFPIYTVFRFLCGFGISGITLSTAILNVEWVSTRMRAIKSIAVGYFYTIGQFILPGLAYVIPQWRWLQLTVSIPFFAFFLLSWWQPESIRWMVLSGRSPKALKTLQQVATFNGKKEEGKKLSLEEIKLNTQKEVALAKAKRSVADLFRTPILRRMTFCLSLAWFSTGFAYYSLAMGVEEFGVNLYILQLIFGGVDVPAKFITMLAISYLGRHTTEAALLLLAGGCILSLIFVPADLMTLRTVLAVFGKGCLSGSFSCLFLFTSELYPTVTRQTGMGISNMWARVGSMTAPLVKITGELKPFIPNVIFGSIALLGGSAALFLPETLNRPLPETIEDVENWSQRAKESKQEPEAEKASQKIPLQAHEPGLGPS
ncbi:organic anion transporter 3 [Odocoileus virginianus]|uniref:Organic anion transporter 3 n=1 Tax=Odocoileus virginianus TaxID=9874 RepID=A0A6J0YW46_ODOVR